MLSIRKSEIPVVLLLLPFIVGIAVAFLSGIHLQTSGLWAILSILCICFIILNFSYNRLWLDKHQWIGGLLLNMFLVAAGWLTTQLHDDLNKSHFSKLKSDYLIVQVVNEPKQSHQFLRFAARVKAVVANGQTKTTHGNLLLTVVTDSSSHAVNYGDIFLMPGSYKLVDGPFNPAEFNYKQYLARQHIYHQSFITRKQLVKIDTMAGNPIVAGSLKLRQHLVDKFKRYITDPEAAAVASTLILGYKADLSQDILQAYSKTGTIHVLSVSGAHVLVIFVFISFLLRPISYYRHGKLINATLSIGLIWGYALLTGFSPAVCRAALMLSMIIIGKTANRQVHSLNVVAVSAFLLLLYDPFLLTDVGFQLSYLAVVGMFTLQPVIYGQYHAESIWGKKLWYLCSASLAAQIATFPVSAYYFHQFPVYFLFSNLLIILPSELIMLIGLLLSALSGMKWLAKPLGHILDYLIVGLNYTLRWIEHLPHAIIGRIWFTNAEWLFWYIVIILTAFYLVQKKSWQLLSALTCLLLVALSVSFTTIKKQKSAHIVFFNVKRNTAILFCNGKKGIMLTDSKRNDKSYQYSIQPCIDSLNIDSVNLIQPHQQFQTNFFRKELNLIQFSNQTVILFDKRLQRIKLNTPLKSNYLLITGNPDTDLNFITKYYRFDTLIIDANNSNQRIDRWMLQREHLKLNIINLKRNKALVSVSK